LVIPDGAREPRRSGTLFRVRAWNEVPGRRYAPPGMTRAWARRARPPVILERAARVRESSVQR
ncbi:MAG: hypothetical protein ACOYM8_15710, partial [Caulobacterales bacterium]